MLGLLAALLQRKRPPFKTIATLTVYLLAVSTGILIYDRWLGKGSPVGELGWLVSAGTVTFICLADLVLLLAMMAFCDKRWRRPPLLPMLIQAGLYIAVCTVARVGGRFDGLGQHLGDRPLRCHCFGDELRIPSNRRLRAALRESREAVRFHSAAERAVRGSRRDDDRGRGGSHATFGRAALSWSFLLGSPLEQLVVRCSFAWGGRSACSTKASLFPSLDSLAGERGPMVFSARSEDQEVARAMRDAWAPRGSGCAAPA